ncbi:hypothetical protein V1477_014803 [Vespula maculifrons]|uniref:Uncharacterized protein n=1 Tax=Vespula maculifrons TaxID=7453 RepID=A0ABD2BII1_VESMC
MSKGKQVVCSQASKLKKEENDEDEDEDEDEDDEDESLKEEATRSSITTAVSSAIIATLEPDAKHCFNLMMYLFSRHGESKEEKLYRDLPSNQLLPSDTTRIMFARMASVDDVVDPEMNKKRRKVKRKEGRQAKESKSELTVGNETRRGYPPTSTVGAVYANATTNHVYGGSRFGNYPEIGIK